MRINGKIAALMLFILVVIGINENSIVMAAEVGELKQQWYETHDYPINPESEEWSDYGMADVINILNPPEELLCNFTTKELAELMMDYPYLWVLTSYEYSERDYFFEFIEENCMIYRELLSRDEGIWYLLNEYRNTGFDVELYNKDPYVIWGYHPMANAEVFGCQFIKKYGSEFEEEEYKLSCEIIGEKAESYLSINSDELKQYLSFEGCPYCGSKLMARGEHLAHWLNTRRFTDIKGAQIVCEEAYSVDREYHICMNGHGVVVVGKTTTTVNHFLSQCPY